MFGGGVDCFLRSLYVGNILSVSTDCFIGSGFLRGFNRCYLICTKTKLFVGKTNIQSVIIAAKNGYGVWKTQVAKQSAFFCEIGQTCDTIIGAGVGFCEIRQF